MFQNRERARQLIDFGDIEIDSMRPTDLDGVMDLHDKGYIFFEMKYEDKELPIGQKLLMERLVKHMAKDGIKAIAIVAEHSVANEYEDVVASRCKVRQLYFSDEMKWRKPKKEMSVKQVIDGFAKIVQ